MPRPPALPLPWECALDVLARHRASPSEPLERVCAALVKARRLGPRERRAVGDLVFSWARVRASAERRIADELGRRSGRAPSVRERDLCALLMAQAGADFDGADRARGALDAALAAVLEDATLTGLGAALPAWLDARIRAERADGAALIEALGKPAPVGLAVDERSVRVDDVVAALSATGARAAASPVVAGAVRATGRVRLAQLPRPLLDAVWPMDEGSQVIVRALDARPGERVLDLCAGAGIKTRVLLQTGASVVAADVSAARLARAPAEARRVVTDGTRPGLAAGAFDKVLVDAPCSGTGTLRRAPDLAHRLREEDLPTLVATQERLLLEALALARSGGLVVYATCSVLRAENEDVVERIMARTPGAHLVPLRSLWGDDVRVDDAGRGQVRLLPHQHGTDGFFVAALRAP